MPRQEFNQAKQVTRVYPYYTLDPAFLKFEQEEYEQAIRASMQEEEDRKLKEQKEEEEIIKMVMEASLKEERERQERIKEIEVQEA